jgi:hypothetical protein
MFERLAKFRHFAQWPSKPLREAVRSHPVHSNDNRPGFRRPEGWALRPHQVLACHWSLAPDGMRLECQWILATADDQPVGDLGRPLQLAGPPLVPNAGRLSPPEQIAS